MTYMLKNAAQSGTGSEAYLGKIMPVAGKTGTTTDSRDRWFCGYTPYYVTAIWTGYDTPAVMSFSGNPAAQIWKKVMTSVSDGMTYTDFPSASLGGPTGIFGTREDLENYSIRNQRRLRIRLPKILEPRLHRRILPQLQPQPRVLL